MAMQYTVGQKLWFASSRRSAVPTEVAVTKVGRKWVTIDDWRKSRFSIETGESHPDDRVYGYVYTSIEAFEAAKRADEVRQAVVNEWHNLRRDLSGRYSTPDDMTGEKIAAARKILFGEGA